MTDDEDILICAVRYCLGRRSYIVSEGARWVRERWGGLTEGTRALLRREVAAHLARHADQRIDEETWADLAAWMEAQR